MHFEDGRRDENLKVEVASKGWELVGSGLSLQYPEKVLVYQHINFSKN